MGFYALHDELTPRETASPACHPRPEKCDPPSKNRVWNFIPDSENRVGQNPAFAQCSRREKSVTLTILASDHPLWPNRDPIQESGGDNIYSFNLNNPILYIDVNGKFPLMAFVASVAFDAISRFIFDRLDAGIEEYLIRTNFMIYRVIYSAIGI